MLSRQVLTRHLQNVTGAIAWTSETSAVRPAPEQILVPVFQTSVSHVLERAHYFLAAQKRILQRKHPIQRGPGTRRDPCPLRGLAVTGRRARARGDVTEISSYNVVHVAVWWVSDCCLHTKF